MKRAELKNYIEKIDENGLLKLCADIYDYKYVTGMLKTDCTVNQLAEKLDYWEIRDFEDIVIEVAMEKFESVVLLLLKSNPCNFLK